MWFHGNVSEFFVECLFPGESESAASTVLHRNGKASTVLHRSGSTTVTIKPSSVVFHTSSHDTGDATVNVVKKRIEDSEDEGSIHAAVIALSFGIALTALLLIFAACHCCRGRRGSRKHRKLNVNTEADYLVDGMYL